MDKDQFEKIIKVIENIDKKLDFIVRFIKAKTPKPKTGIEEKKVLKLCDKEHTADDIAKETGKNKGNVKVILSNLRNKGVIENLKINNKTVYKKIW